MSAPRGMARTAFEQRGAVLVLMALILPVLIGAGGLVVDIGNWFAHKRHLQVQADAGALAAAGKFRVPCAPAAIEQEAGRYSSVEYTGPGPGYNPQLATPTGGLHREMNSKTYHNQASPVDDTVVEGDPCTAKMIDVKLTETDLPWFLKVAQVPFVNAHARVEIKQKTTGKGALPIAVPEVGPKKAKAIFVNETTGAVIASTDLIRTGTSAQGLALWSNSGVPAAVAIATAKVGVRIVLSAGGSTSCGDPLVDCYGAGTNTAIVAGDPGLVHIRGWSATPLGSATSPQPRDVRLLGAGCEDGYFTATAAYPCTLNVGAIVDFGGPVPATARVLAKKTGANNSTTVELTPPATAGGQWTGGPFSISATPSTTSIDLLWQTGCNTDRTRPCSTTKTSLGTVQRTFVGKEDQSVSGPIKLLRLSENGAPGANSFERSGAAHDLVVTLGLKPSLHNAQSITDPIVSMKVAGGGSQNQGLDCDPDLSNIRDELANGCGPTYTVNDGLAPCPGGTSDLWRTPEPWKCVAISTGAAVGQVTQGMNKRILGATNASVCTAPNNWASFPDLPVGDPRVVNVILTPFGAFAGSGGATVPVTGFASFYVTGWDGGACQNAGDDPAGQGAIVGHYIKNIDTLSSGGGEEFCDFDSFGSCVAVFTR
jgi:hypothetical protein